MMVLIGSLLSVPGWAAAPFHTRVLNQAELEGLAGRRSVELPHVLQPADFVASGSRVRYRLTVEMPTLPEEALGVFVNKISLSGRVFLNGQLIDSCDHALHRTLEELRCLHQPQLFMFKPGEWRVGSNTLEFEVFASSRQTNGLSAVELGDAITMEEERYLPQKWRRGLLLQGLAWLSAMLGLLSLVAAAMLRGEKVYLWFGLTTITNALASLNGFVVRSPLPIEVFNCLVFSLRLATAPLMMLTMLAVFDRIRRWHSQLCIAFVLVAPLAIWVSGNNRGLVTALYLPFIAAAPWLMFMTLRWSRQSGHWLHLGSALLFISLFGSAVWDWLRLAGKTPFEGVYLFSYTFTGMLILLWVLLSGQLISALKQSRQLGALMEKQLRERTAFELTENIPIGTYTMVLGPNDEMAHFSFLSRRFLEMTGLDRETARSDPLQAFACVHPEDREAWIRLNEQCFANRTPFLGRARLIVRGEVRHVVAESVPRTLADGTTIWEGVLIDETERVLENRAAELDRAALQANLLKESRMQERVQLLQDMHDGFGSQIASVRMMAGKGRISPEEFPAFLDEIMADLHLVVDTLNQEDITLEDALIDMRHRLQRRLAGIGPQRDWRIELTEMPLQSSRTVLQIMRVLQEALHNAQKHAHAENIWIDARYTPDAGMLSVSIRDDGQGLPEQPRPGRGLFNMEQRCREIGATFSMIRRRPGTEIVMTLKVPTTD